jgi:hypothetical protein
MVGKGRKVKHYQGYKRNRMAINEVLCSIVLMIFGFEVRHKAQVVIVNDFCVLSPWAFKKSEERPIMTSAYDYT